MKRVIVSVTNDLTTDQRVDRSCITLKKMGFDVLLAGRRKRNSLPLRPRTYRTKRMGLFFEKGPCFYAAYNIRLFFLLLFSKADLFLSNDLDTLPAAFFASRLRRIPLVHDCHEYFRGVPELVGRNVTGRIWKFFEDIIFPRLKAVYAVNESVARLYHAEYGNEITVIRNVPISKVVHDPKRKEELGIPQDHRVILYQGAVNVDRGLEEAVAAMKCIRTPSTLLILGTGDVFGKMKRLAVETGVSDRVHFTGEIPFEELANYTALGEIGLSIEKEVSLNYFSSLPNKFLDYISAGIPVLVSPFPEMTSIVRKYGIGEILEKHTPEHLAAKLDEMFGDRDRMASYRAGLRAAAVDLCWEKEEPSFRKIFEPYG